MPVISDRLSRASSSSSGPPDRGSAGTPDLFVYGTLALDDVVRTLIDRVPASELTSAPGWRAARLPDLPYPGLVRDPEAEASGRVYTDLSETEWSVLDAFEDPTYSVEVVHLTSGRSSLAYVWPDEVLADSWTTGSLEGADMQAYLERCARWRSGWEARSGSG
ncbi:hypothetical protein GCM10023200_19630 [Actinomycetospora chlora]|uniref:Putative gamma-glutamylcyclotransferase n=1 Tax=Actinomycetospora chlora TaxID=663608 RepID=A0ABP9AT84_9PSEU